MDNKNQVDLFTIQDIFDEQDKQIPVNPNKKYDPLHFWEDFGDKYFRGMEKTPEMQRNIPWLVHKVKALGIKSVLDIGCGFCRLEPFLIDGAGVEKITAVDISPKQIESAKEFLKDYPQLDKITIEKQSVKSLPYERESFDCVIASELFTHLHPPKVNLGLRAMRNITKKYVILIERFIFAGEHPYPHVWSQEYLETAGNCGLRVLESKVINNAVLGIILSK